MKLRWKYNTTFKYEGNHKHKKPYIKKAGQIKMQQGKKKNHEETATTLKICKSKENIMQCNIKGKLCKNQ